MAKVKHVLNVTERDPKGSAAARRVRAQGLVPAVIYSKGFEPKHISVNASDWEALSKFEFNLVSLVSGDKETLALLKEVQHDFIKGKASHIDFLAVRDDQEITAVVPVHPGHTAAAGTAQGGMLEQIVYELEVSCLPANLPEFIVADVSGINLGEHMTVAEMTLPEGVKAKTHGEVVMFEVVDPNKIAEDLPAPAAPVEGATTAEPEVVGEKERAEKAAEREESKKK